MVHKLIHKMDKPTFIKKNKLIMSIMPFWHESTSFAPTSKPYSFDIMVRKTKAFK